MSEHTEWASAVAAARGVRFIQPGEHTDEHGQTNDETALIFYTGSSLVVIQGTPRELREFCYRALLEIGV